MHKTDCNCLELLDTKKNVFTRLSLKFAEMISWLSTGRFWCSAGVCYRFEHEFDKRNKKSNFSLHLKHWSSTSSADEVLEHEIISFCMRKKMAKSLKLLISIIIQRIRYYRYTRTDGYVEWRHKLWLITYDAIWKRWPDDDVRIELVYIF